MKSVVIDFEFCEISRTKRKLNGTNLYHEIIEFGAVILDDDMNILGRFQKLVKPQFGSVSPYISNLTGIKNEMLENEAPFAEVMQAFRQWIGEGEYEICSWSMNDYKQLWEEIHEKCPVGVYLDGFQNWRDVQREFGDGLAYAGKLSLQNAMYAVDTAFEGKAHQALADAENTSKLVALLANPEMFERKTKAIHDLFAPKEPTTLGSMFGDLFAQIAG